VRCSQCPTAAVIDQPYAGKNLCAQHFGETVSDRVRAEFHRQLPRFPGGTIAVAVSGGKDSAVALSLTQRYFARRTNVRIVALTIDEGIAVYRASTLVRAQELTRNLGIEHRVLRFRDELHITTDGAAEQLPKTAPCSFCGVWRRKLLNRGARDEGADAVVVGFNLDDLAQTILMNLVRGDLARLSRMAPHRKPQPGLVPRIAPLAAVPEREVYLFARLRGLPFDHGECPHAVHAARNVFREVVWQLEEALPGTRQALLQTQQRLAALLENGVPSGAPGRCAVCGEPSASEFCRACEYLRQTRTPGSMELA